MAASGQGTRMRNFKDTNLKNSRFFLELVYALEPRAVDFAMVNNGLDHDSLMSNAKVSEVIWSFKYVYCVQLMLLCVGLLRMWCDV